MPLTADANRRIVLVAGAEDASFVELVGMAEVDRATAFRGASMRDTDLRGEDLCGFDFTDADFTGADVRGTDLSRTLGLTLVMFREALFDDTTRWPAEMAGQRHLPQPEGRASAETAAGPAPASSPRAPEMIRIERGEFTMGVPQEEMQNYGTQWDKFARPQHIVRIRYPFWLGKYPVTCGEYSDFVQETDRPWEAPEFAWMDRHAAVNVGFNDAIAYISWLNNRTEGQFRLPSEAEWEYACRAGTKTARYWGNETDRRLANLGKATSVDAHPANPWGLCDMLGNVWEWCQDTWHFGYRDAPSDGSVWRDNQITDHVIRGGNSTGGRKLARCGARAKAGGAPSPWIGFRLARTL